SSRATVKVREGHDVPADGDMQSSSNPGGNGRFIVVSDPQHKVPGQQAYQGIVPSEGSCSAEACEAYFLQSEQVPTSIRSAVRHDASGCVGGGSSSQHSPEGEEGRERSHARSDHPQWEHIATMGGSVKAEESLDPALSMESIAWRSFHEEREVRVERGPASERGCRCTVEHYRSISSRFPESERAEMRNEDGVIVVDCAFCSRDFAIDSD
ncbi:hypothetical protein OY671_009256, partial [Metschnikowia pulcherrima]